MKYRIESRLEESDFVVNCQYHFTQRTPFGQGETLQLPLTCRIGVRLFWLVSFQYMHYSNHQMNSENRSRQGILPRKCVLVKEMVDTLCRYCGLTVPINMELVS